MSPVMIIYWLFFIALFIFTLVTLNKLSKASKKSEFPPQITSVESFLIWTNPNFPVLSLAKILPGTFVAFGILGTFLGFASGISKIDPLASADEILNGIGTLLAGMKTAFYTSIIGVILSVFFSIAFQIPLHKIKTVIKNQPNIEEKQREDMTLSMREQLEQFQAIIKRSMQEYTEQVQELTYSLISAKDSMESLPEKFTDVGKSLEESIAPVKETFGQMQETLQGYAEQAKLMESASGSIGETLKNFSETNEKITQNISEIFEKSETMNKNIVEENQALTESHKTTLEEYKQLDENISTALEKLNENVKLYSETMEKTLVETLENFTKAAEKVSNSLLGIEE